MSKKWSLNMESQNRKNTKQCDIHSVVFNAADYLHETCQKGKETMCMCKNDQDCKEHSEVEYCLCISRTGIDGDEFGKWTCSSCKKEVFNKHRKY